MSALIGRVSRAFLFPAVLGLITLSLASASSADPAPGPAPAAQQTPAPSEFRMQFGFSVGDEQQPTTSHVAKLGSDIVFPQGRFDGAILGSSGRAPITGKLSNVKVDGRVLDVGPNCRTAQPASVTIKSLLPLQANNPPPVKVTTTFATPPFAGCGVREDLSPLLTGLVAGPGNTLVTNLKLRCIGSGAPPSGCGS
ncbi:hypothetical protein ACFWY9_08145 [Amycolatopsis sp. NPDC059027]|uniref:hypothetical protein n=1 Tax=Amycolatopsis sp. NPDC059027 TaxID=3346709 RepID=UPI00366B7A21